jgi:hypothetical protein
MRCFGGGEASKAFRVSRLSGMGWCYIYRFHGGNAWDAAHHRAISAVKHMAQARLLPRLALLRDRVGEYQPELPGTRTPLGSGSEYATLGEPDDLAGSPERDAQAAFFLRGISTGDRSGKDVQIP